MTLKEAQNKYECRKVFEIMIEGKPYQVWGIDKLTHENGRMNGTPDTWWLDFSQNGLEEKELIPYVDKMIHRICWEVDYKQYNNSKYKWDEWRFTSRGTCILRANGKEVYRFYSHDIGYGLAKAQTTIVKMMEHPYNFLNPSEEDGRKIYYYGLPAFVRPSNGNPGEISIDPDYSTGIEESQWWEFYRLRSQPVQKPKDPEDAQFVEMEEERLAETREYGYINHGDVFWDGMIDWFRK